MNTLLFNIYIFNILIQNIEFIKSNQLKALLHYCNYTKNLDINIIKVLQNTKLCKFYVLRMYCYLEDNHNYDIIKYLSKDLDHYNFNVYKMYCWYMKTFNSDILNILCKTKKDFKMFLHRFYKPYMIIAYNDVKHLIDIDEKIMYEKKGVKFSRSSDITKKLHKVMNNVPIDACNIIQDYLK